MCVFLEISFLVASDLQSFDHVTLDPARHSASHPASLCRRGRRVYYIALDALTNPISDAIIHTRITNDERALRRIVKKFHNYASLAHTSLLPPAHGGSLDDAREAFLVELASFELALKKSLMICEAESRQVEEYQRERRRIGACLRVIQTQCQRGRNLL